MKKFPLIVERHPENYQGYDFVSLLIHNKDSFLVIINNCANDMISAYVLDLCVAEKIEEEEIINVAREWYEKDRANFPISVEFSKRNLHEKYGKILRSFNVEFVTRVVGNVPTYNFTKTLRVRRRRKRTISTAIQIKQIS